METVKFAIRKKRRRKVVGLRPESDGHTAKPRGTGNTKSLFIGLSKASEPRKKKVRRLSRDEKYGSEDGGSQKTDAEVKVIPLQRSAGFSGKRKLTSEDLRNYPEEHFVTDTDAYSKMPVADFGMAMLRGMGWKAGTSSVSSKPYMPELRNGRMGLGAEHEKTNKEKSGGGKQVDSREKAPSSWLRPGIRVRVVSMGPHRGEKGVVLDVDDLSEGPGLVCTLAIEKTGLTLSGILEKSLTTALPKRGGRVVVVAGEHVSKTGTLLARNRAEEEATVLLDGETDPRCFEFDAVAEYVSI